MNQVYPETCILKQDLRADFYKYGYITVSGITQNTIRELYDLYKSIPVKDYTKFGYSTMLNSYEVNVNIHQIAKKILEPYMNSIFGNYKSLSSTFLTKPAFFNEEMSLHQDWSFTHENKFTPITLWIPLQKTTSENGGIFLLPRSHNIIANYRSYTLPSYRFPSNGKLKNYLKEIDLETGSALLFNPSIFHGSTPNLTSNERISFTTTILPYDAPYIHVKKVNEQVVQIHYLSEDTFFKDLKIINEKGAFEGAFFEDKEYQHVLTSEDEILKLINIR